MLCEKLIYILKTLTEQVYVKGVFSQIVNFLQYQTLNLCSLSEWRTCAEKCMLINDAYRKGRGDWQYILCYILS